MPFAERLAEARSATIREGLIVEDGNSSSVERLAATFRCPLDAK
jgi:hypothetical protein